LILTEFSLIIITVWEDRKERERYKEREREREIGVLIAFLTVNSLPVSVNHVPSFSRQAQVTLSHCLTSDAPLPLEFAILYDKQIT
jgi:hypothetical protein